MTVEQIIEVLQAFSEQKQLEYYNITGQIWANISPNVTLTALLNMIQSAVKIRIRKSPRECYAVFDDSGKIIACNANIETLERNFKHDVIVRMREVQG